MPSFGNPFSLGALTPWKAARSKTNDDAPASIEKEHAAIAVTINAAEALIPGSIEYFEYLPSPQQPPLTVSFN